MKEILSNLIDSAAIGELREDEYMQDGVIRCTNCGGVRETTVLHPFTGKESRVRCICPCQKEQLDKDEERLKQVERERRRKAALTRCFGTSGYDGYTFNTDDKADPENTRRMWNYAQHFERFRASGEGLLLFGDVGTGKTFLSACVANALLDKGYNVIMSSVPELIGKIQRHTYGKLDLLDECTKSDLLILDDLGTERGTETAKEQLYSVVDGRYKARKPVIISTNLTADELRNPDDVMSARIYGRLLERCLPIRVNGVDRRKHAANYDEMRSLLDS